MRVTTLAAAAVRPLLWPQLRKREVGKRTHPRPAMELTRMRRSRLPMAPLAPDRLVLLAVVPRSSRISEANDKLQSDFAIDRLSLYS